MKILGFILLLMTALLLQQYATFCQLGLTYDSQDYLHAAQSFREIGVLYNANQSLYVERPPLFPLSLALLGEQAEIYMRYINTLCLGILLVILYELGKLCISNVSFRLLFILTQIWGIPLLFVHSFLWSEPLFMLFLYAHLHLLHLYLRKPSVVWMLGMIICSLLMGLQRNPGIFFIFGTGLALFFFGSRKWAVIYVSTASSAWALWTSYSIYHRGWGFHSVSESWFQKSPEIGYDLLNVISAWFFPLIIPTFWRFILLGLGLVLFLGLLRKGNVQKYLDHYSASLGIILGLYGMILLLLERVGYHETERYLSVIYPIFFLLFFRYLAIGCDTIKSPRIRQGLFLILIIWMIYPLGRSLKNVTLWHQRNCQEVSTQAQTLFTDTENP